MPDRIVHVCLNVPGAAAAVEWYTTNFDLEEVESWRWSWERDGGHVENRYVADEAGMMIQLRDAEGQTSFERGEAWDHLGVLVDDVEAAVDRIDHHGVVLEPQYNPSSGADIAFVEDPYGHVLELLRPDEETA